MLRAALVLVATLVPAIGGSAAASAAPAEKAIWGPTTLPSGASAFPLYQRLGVDTFQIQLSFEAAAPRRPTNPLKPGDPAYKWPTDIDEAVAGARRRGIKVAILVNRSPGWANGGRSGIWAPRPKHFAQFVRAASRRYPSVRRWMIWGEPNRFDRFQPNPGPAATAGRAYARLLDAAYRGLKRASRRNVVIGGMTWTGGEIRPKQFLRALRMPSGRRPRLDWYGHNPFPFRRPRLSARVLSGGWRDISDMDVFAREVAQNFPGSPRLWLSEYTVQSDRPSNIFEIAVSKREQARYLRAGYRIANQVDAVVGLGWIGLLDQEPAPGNSNWGLMTHDGRPKPALRAYRRVP